MRYICLIAAKLLLAHLAMSQAPAAQEAEWQPLFNGTDLSGWQTYLDKPEREWNVPGLKRDAKGKYLEPIGRDRDPLNVFTVVQLVDRPAMRFSGQGFGTLTTTRSFENYHLRLQYKWGEKRWSPRETMIRDSGLLYHVYSESGVVFGAWPRCVEFQIQEGDTGDLYALDTHLTVPATQPVNASGKSGGYTYDPRGQPTLFGGTSPAGVRCIKQETAERPHGEWNTVELICLNGDSIHIVNGKVVMRLKNAQRVDGNEPTPLRSGAIALQTEGAEVFYRDIEIREITQLPKEYAEE